MADTSLEGFGENNQASPTRLDQILAHQVKSIADAPKAILGQLINMRNNAFNAFWATGGEGITPMHRAKALGPRAIGVFSDDKAMTEFVVGRLTAAGVPPERIAQLLPSIPARYDVAWNEDGSVTIIDKELGAL